MIILLLVLQYKYDVVIFFRNYCHYACTFFYFGGLYIIFAVAGPDIVNLNSLQMVIMTTVCLVDPRVLEQPIWPVPYWFEEYVRAVPKAVEGTVNKREKREAVGSGSSGEVDGMFAQCGTV